MPRLWVHDGGGLEATRDRIRRGDPAVTDSVLRLIAAAYTMMLDTLPVTRGDRKAFKANWYELGAGMVGQ